MKSHFHAVERCDDENVSFGIIRVGQSEIRRKIQDRKQFISRLEHAFKTRIGIGHGSDAAELHQFLHLCHIDSVVVARYREFQDFQFISSSLQQNIAFHTASPFSPFFPSFSLHQLVRSVCAFYIPSSLETISVILTP